MKNIFGHMSCHSRLLEVEDKKNELSNLTTGGSDKHMIVLI